MYNKIKKQNGEQFAKAIRAFDSGIFDIQNLDKIVKYAGREAEPIMSYLVSLKNIQIEEHGVHKKPIELLSMAGYDAFYADTLEKQNSIKHLYREDETLCTFRDETRYQKYHIIHCIKKNVADIERSENPERDDEYGTSVISIQILKTGGFISIKNRYNHTITNPDNTFNSNPDNIIEGLSQALKHKYNVDFSSQSVALPDNYIKLKDQILKYNHEVLNTYFGEDFYVENAEVIEIDKSKELMLDNFILNWQTKEIKNPSYDYDAFTQAFADEIANKKLQIKNNKNGEKSLFADGIEILTTQNGTITSLNFPNTKKIGKMFLYHNKNISKISLPNVIQIDNEFLFCNRKLLELDLPNVLYITNNFMKSNIKLAKISLPNAYHIGDNFLYNNNYSTDIYAPELKQVGLSFLFNNLILKKISFPKLEIISDTFIVNNKMIYDINLPNVQKIGKLFLYWNLHLKSISMPKVKEIGDCFMENNEILSKIDIRNATIIKHSFLAKNIALKELYLPKITIIEPDFLLNNKNLVSIYLLNAKEIKNGFLSKNKKLKTFICDINLFPQHIIETLANNAKNQNIKNILIDGNKCITR